MGSPEQNSRGGPAYRGWEGSRLSGRLTPESQIDLSANETHGALLREILRELRIGNALTAVGLAISTPDVDFDRAGIKKLSETLEKLVDSRGILLVGGAGKE